MFGGFEDVVQDLRYIISDLSKSRGSMKGIHIRCAYTDCLSGYLDMCSWVVGRS